LIYNVNGGREHITTTIPSKEEIKKKFDGLPLKNFMENSIVPLKSHKDQGYNTRGIRPFSFIHADSRILDYCK